MTIPDELTTEQLMHRYLSPAATIALQQFMAGTRVGEQALRSMVQITGRGYQPPTTVEGWRNVYDFMMQWMESDD